VIEGRWGRVTAAAAAAPMREGDVALLSVPWVSANFFNYRRAWAVINGGSKSKSLRFPRCGLCNEVNSPPSTRYLPLEGLRHGLAMLKEADAEIAEPRVKEKERERERETYRGCFLRDAPGVR